MRIVAGSLKGRALVTPDGRDTRPTSDRAREAMFNVIAHAQWAPALDGARVIDLFAGSGALGFEAISRGAGFCLFVENSASARGAIRTNVETFQLFGNTRIHRRSAADLGEKPAGVGDTFDLAFLDPPYQQGLGPQAIAELKVGNWLAPEALVILEVGKEETPELPDWDIRDERVYGAAKIIFMTSR